MHKYSNLVPTLISQNVRSGDNIGSNLGTDGNFLGMAHKCHYVLVQLVKKILGCIFLHLVQPI